MKPKKYQTEAVYKNSANSTGSPKNTKQKLYTKILLTPIAPYHIIYLLNYEVSSYLYSKECQKNTVKYELAGCGKKPP